MKPWKIVVISSIVGLALLFFFGLGNNPRYIPSPLIGTKAPAFSGPTADGGSFTSADLEGKVSLVTFWATWCTTCRADEPLVSSLIHRFGSGTDAEFKVVGVATQDTLEKVKAYVKKGSRPYPNVYDEKGSIAIDFGVYGVPESYLLDREGNIVQKIIGPINRKELGEKIEALLKGGTAG